MATPEFPVSALSLLPASSPALGRSGGLHYFWASNFYAMMRLAIFASGSGSNAQKIMEYFATGDLARVVLVVANRREAGVIERAKKAGVAVEYLPKSRFVDGGQAVCETLSKHRIDFVILAGFLLLMPEKVVDKYAGRMVNIHPSLLPDFGGAGMYGNRVHEAVIASGQPRSGISIHLVNNEFDKGEILFQADVEIREGETPESLRQKIQRLEHAHYPRVIEELVRKRTGESGAP